MRAVDTSSKHITFEPNASGVVHLSPGLDSDVFRAGDLVYKVYHSLEVDQLRTYKDVTDRAVVLLQAEPFERTYSINGAEYRVRFDVLPIDAAGYGSVRPGESGLEHLKLPGSQASRQDRVEGQSPISISQFVAGPSLFGTDSIDKHPSIAKERHPNFATDGNDKFYVDIACECQFNPRLKRAILSDMDTLAKHLEEKLGVSGLSIGRVNVKVLYDKASGKGIVLVTDLANAVTDVRMGESGPALRMPVRPDPRYVECGQ